MKTNLFFIACLCLIPFLTTHSQNVPNGGFEDWEIRVLYEEPESWNTGNLEALISNTATAFDTSDCYSGNSALRLKTAVTGQDTLFGYAFCGGTVTGGEVSDTLFFTGGIPISGAPDSLFGYFKFSIPENDTAIVLISFKKEGTIISQNIFPLFGSQNSYLRMGWEVETMIEIPDTVMVAFACSNPDNPVPGGWLQVDSVWFGGIPDSIPNNDFEVWEESSYQEPVNWVTGNLFSHIFGGDICATPTADAHSGSNALRIESTEVWLPGGKRAVDMLSNPVKPVNKAQICGDGLCEPGEDSESCPSDCSPPGGTIIGFAIPYSTSFILGESMPTFDIDFNPSALTGYYKFTPTYDDTALVYINLIDTQENTYETGWLLMPADVYTPFVVDLPASPVVTITKASIVFSTTIYFMQGSGLGEVGSVLYLDDIVLIDTCDEFPPYEIASVDIPTCDDNTAVLDAGEGWDEYLWSTEETTQTITVTITETASYSVTVTDAETDCQFSDEVEIGVPTGCGDAVEITENRSPALELYPNPASNKVTVELLNLKSGIYTLDVLDITGKIVFSEQLTISQNTKKTILDLTGYSEGLYLLKLSGEAFSQCERLMIK